MSKQRQQQEGLTTTQILATFFLLVLAILAVGISFLQIRNNIYNPFAISAPETDSTQAQMQKLLSNKQQINKRRDSDDDGLNDYQELNIYNTSPYIADTDSDGIDDNAEIQQGTDPLCPQDETCKPDETTQPEQQDDLLSGVKPDIDATSSNAITAQQKVGNNKQNNQDNVGNNLLTNEKSQRTSSQQKKQLNDQLIKKLLKNPDRLRTLMQRSGKISKEKLKKIDDQVLVEVVKRILSNKGYDLNTTSSISSTSTQQ